MYENFLERVLFSEKQLDERVTQIAKQIENDYNEIQKSNGTAACVTAKAVQGFGCKAAPS